MKVFPLYRWIPELGIQIGKTNYVLILFVKTVALTKLFFFLYLESFTKQVLRLQVQKQPSEVFCKKRCSSNFCKLHRKAPVLKSLFNKIVIPTPVTLWKKKPLRCFLVKFTKFLLLLSEHFLRLLLKIAFKIFFYSWFIRSWLLSVFLYLHGESSSFYNKRSQSVRGFTWFA